MLSLLLILSGLGHMTTVGQHSEAPLLQITVPQKIGANTSDGNVSETHATYSINIEGKTYTFLLEKQSFIHPHFLVYLYNELGILYQDSSFTNGHCFYQGYATDIPNSLVTLNICSGLRGLLQLENVSYGIEPLETSPTYEHVIYQIKNNTIEPSSFQESYPMIKHVDKSYRILVKSKVNSGVLLKRTLKIQIVMDKSMYDYMGSEVAVAVEKVAQIVGLINTMFSQLKMNIMLSSLELWSDQNKISTSGDANQVLQSFLSWKQKVLFERSHDMAFLLIHRNNPTYVGATYQGMACDLKFAAGIALFPKTITLEAFSVVMVQLLGINLGLTYDDIYKCYCPGTTCIMNPEAIQSKGAKFFSSCSVDEFKQRVLQPQLECLQNKTVSKVTYQGKTSTCGNKVLEPGEQCDCGLPTECSHKKCCNPQDCTLIGFAECGSGPCCSKNRCMIVDRGPICRRSTDVCDFAEHCNGTSEFCGPDVKAADLQPCNNETAYCYRGICQTTDRQCTALFGKYARGSTYLCTEEINFQNDKYGNCITGRCNFKNTLCAKLVCDWTRTDLQPREFTSNYDVQYTYLGGHICMSAHLKTTGMADRTRIAEGTVCGHSQVCIRRACIHFAELPNTTNCNEKVKCKGHGICTNLDTCHCDVGYAPPTCEPLPSSPGGSINNGLWLSTDKSISFLVKQRTPPKNNGLLISFYVFLPLLILTAIIGFKWKKIRRFWNREETVSSGSILEDSNSATNQS
ncbi:disintegrin and metalloproteinase domain-containing protein 18-like [Carlito syrichta]|uniref:Disintegrin and metalloproteinase domain-containing protein 18-like n=1 Tax=Carlito syrichta TaxID=1868482 RepID=A0A1U7U2C9_CARSF|nr:disintegrin and metalloproteinase domain-containing protein 18-like [Carlito syrichta]